MAVTETSSQQELEYLIRARYGLIYVVSSEEERGVPVVLSPDQQPDAEQDSASSTFTPRDKADVTSEASSADEAELRSDAVSSLTSSSG